MNRRSFLKTTGVAATAASRGEGTAGSPPPAVDFRYAPGAWQSSYCFPDDPHKSLVGEHGDLRYGHAPRTRPFDYFTEVVDFRLLGMEPGQLAGQDVEEPGVPIFRTRFAYAEAYLELTTFATNREGEGRVDNVILEVRPKTARRVHASPVVRIRTRKEASVATENGASTVRLGDALFVVSDVPLVRRDDGHEILLVIPQAVAAPEEPLRYFFRFPQEGQPVDRIREGLAAPEALLAEARQFWKNWKAFGGGVSWQLSGRYHEFLIACARNIQQARELRDGKLTFQVGPTVYRGLWVVDGHFLLEAARYLGYDAEAQQGLESTWARQEPEGIIYAGAGREHWKDTGIALFTMVRQAELSQDWSYFRSMQPNVLRAVRFLRTLRDKGRTDGSPNGRYGLIPPGFGDGGLARIRPEFTNTLWVLAGLRAIADAADAQRVAGLEEVKPFHDELRTAMVAAAREEMRRHEGGFAYLPMLMKDDPQWAEAGEWNKPRPQGAQWALSHAIYPGILFDRNDPIVRGHVALMQNCTQEDIPAETGWIFHGGVWNYNAAFVAHVYLWAGLADWARLTFHGFLNHASPSWCWREEQPLQGSLAANYVGDMPHNWASAECVLYLRHLLALEDGAALRLLAGIGDPELAAAQGLSLAASPTRFGRVSMTLEPEAKGRAWRLRFERARGPEPKAVRLPTRLGSRMGFAEVSGAAARREADMVFVAPDATQWTATWRSGI